jgi:hypothetical protein
VHVVQLETWHSTGHVAVGNEEPTADRTALLQILVDGVSDQST